MQTASSNHHQPYMQVRSFLPCVGSNPSKVEYFSQLDHSHICQDLPTKIQKFICFLTTDCLCPWNRKTFYLGHASSASEFRLALVLQRHYLLQRLCACPFIKTVLNAFFTNYALYLQWNRFAKECHVNNWHLDNYAQSRIHGGLIGLHDPLFCLQFYTNKSVLMLRWNSWTSGLPFGLSRAHLAIHRVILHE